MKYLVFVVIENNFISKWSMLLEIKLMSNDIAFLLLTLFKKLPQFCQVRRDKNPKEAGLVETKTRKERAIVMRKLKFVMRQ